MLGDPLYRLPRTVLYTVEVADFSENLATVYSCIAVPQNADSRRTPRSSRVRGLGHVSREDRRRRSRREHLARRGGVRLGHDEGDAHERARALPPGAERRRLRAPRAHS